MVLSVEDSVGLHLPSRKQVKCEWEGLCSSSQRSMKEFFIGSCGPADVRVFL